MSKLPNIMWFTTPQRPRQRRQHLWYMVIVVLLLVLVTIGGLQYLLKQNYSNFSQLKSIITQNIFSPSVQRIASTTISYFQQGKVLPTQELLSLYTDWYNERCLTSASVGEPLCELYPHRDELLNYLGYDQPKSYLILLQNSAEVRPNGWFYGSFIRVTVASGMIQDLSIHDSYEVPFTNSGISLTLPERTNNYLWHTSATFIAGNKFGFTMRDGRVISSIYDKTYNTNTDGVIFISTDALTTLIPSLQEQLWRWQFINAAVDLIRGHDASFKKEIYMKELTTYIDTNKVFLITQAVSRYHDLTRPGMMQIYLPNASTALQTTFAQLNRITELKAQHLYLRDLNQAYNKIDNFVVKRARIQNQQGLIMTESDSNIINLQHIATWSYVLGINYQLNIPKQYIRMMTDLEHEYGISLTERERHILGLDPVFEYSSVVFAWSGIVMDSITGQVDKTVIFAAAPDQWASYHVLGTGSRELSISFVVK